MKTANQQFLEACKSGDAVLAKHLAATEISIDPDYRDENGWHAIHWAALRGHGAVVAGLLSLGIDPNTKTKTGQTPLHKAAYGSHNLLLEFLLAKGSSCMISDKFKKRAIDIANNNMRGHEAKMNELADIEWNKWKETGKDVKEWTPE